MDKNNFAMYGNPIAPKNATGKLKKIYQELQDMLGDIMPHVQIHATHAIDDMKCFTDPMKMTRNHPDIPLLWFVLMRLYVARKDNYPYCIKLNTMMLYNNGIKDKQIEAYIKDIDKAPLNDKEILLLKKAIKSIYDSHHFTEKDFEELYQVGYSDKTIYEIITYCTNFSGIAKRLNTYLIKKQDK